MARDRLPPIEFERVDDGPTSSSSRLEVDASRVRRPPGRPWRWVAAGAAVVLVLVAATTMRRLSDERDQAKAEATRVRSELDDVRYQLSVTEDQASEFAALAAELDRSFVPGVERYRGALFTISSSPSLAEGAIGIVITTDGSQTLAQTLAWVVVDGRGAVPGDEYVLEGGLCSNGTAVPLGEGFSIYDSAASSAEGDLRLFGGPLGFIGPPGATRSINDRDVWAHVRHGNEVLAAVRGPLSIPTWVPPSDNPCDPALKD